MKSLEELVEEFKREVLGQGEPQEESTPQPAQPASPEPGPTSRSDDPASERDLDLDIDIDLDVQAPPGRVTTWTRRPAGPSVNLLPDQTPIVPQPPARAPTPPRQPKPVDPGRVQPEPRRGTRLRRSLVLTLLAIVGLGALAAVTLLWGRPSAPNDGLQPVQPLAEQDVVTWAVWDPEDDVAYITAVTRGGDLDPIALGIPEYTVVSMGEGVDTVGDAAALQDAGLVAATVENLIGVRVDASEGSTLEDLAAVVDLVGGIEVDGRTMSGAEALRYLAEGNDEESSAEFRFLRWQEIVEGVLGASAGRAEALAEVLRPEIAAVIAAAGTGEHEVLELPVTDVGSGLARADRDATAALVAERFVPTSETGRVVRLLLLNGSGTPGAVERVSRILVPSGFQLVSSQDAPTSDVPETQIIATDEGFLPEAEVARRLLGVGTVYLGEQPTRVADVTVIIGRDLGGQ